MWAKIKAWFYKLIGRKAKEDEVFGLEVFDENGDKTLSVTDRTLSLVYVDYIDYRKGQTIDRDYSSMGSKVILLRNYSPHPEARGPLIELRIDGPIVKIIAENRDDYNITCTLTLGVLL